MRKKLFTIIGGVAMCGVLCSAYGNSDDTVKTDDENLPVVYFTRDISPGSSMLITSSLKPHISSVSDSEREIISTRASVSLLTLPVTMIILGSNRPGSIFISISIFPPLFHCLHYTTIAAGQQQLLFTRSFLCHKR